MVISNSLFHALLFRAAAVDTGKLYAVKIIENIEENIEEILQEYQILVEHSLHPNIPYLQGAFRFVLENQYLHVM